MCAVNSRRVRPASRMIEGRVVRGGLAGRGLALPPHLCHPVGMDTSTTPRISPVLEPETMTALMLHYVLSHEEVAHQYATALLLRLSAEPRPS